jgi:uncharacterized protein (DUF58 family)
MIVPTDRLLTWAAVLLPSTLVAAIAPQAALLPVLLFGILSAIAFVDAMNAPAAKRGIRLSLPDIVRMSRNKPAIIPLRIHKEAAEAVDIKVGLPLPREVRSDNEVLDILLPAGAADMSVPWPCTPEQRGVFTLTAGYFEVRSSLGFWHVRDSSEFKSQLRVYPDMTRERTRLAAIFLNRGNFGIHTHRTVGQGRDFEKLRDYLPGDSFDDIHWKATAKRGKPVTKLYQIERTQEIYVVIDASRLSARIMDGEPVLEKFIASALVLGHRAAVRSIRSGGVREQDKALYPGVGGQGSFQRMSRRALHSGTRDGKPGLRGAQIVHMPPDEEARAPGLTHRPDRPGYLGELHEEHRHRIPPAPGACLDAEAGGGRAIVLRTRRGDNGRSLRETRRTYRLAQDQGNRASALPSRSRAVACRRGGPEQRHGYPVHDSEGEAGVVRGV